MNKLPIWEHDEDYINELVKSGLKYTPYETWLRGLYLYNQKLLLGQKYIPGSDNNLAVCFWGQDETPYKYMMDIIKEFRRRKLKQGKKKNKNS